MLNINAELGVLRLFVDITDEICDVGRERDVLVRKVLES